jgi:hypothetical protein
MTKMIRYALLVLCLVICQSCGDSKDAPPAHQGDRPSNKADIAVKADTLTFTFQRFVTPSESVRKAAEFLVSNGFSKDVAAVKLTFLYQDAAGKTIRPYQWSISEAPVWLEAGATKTTVAGHRIPEEAISVDVIVREIIFRDGSSISPGLRE